MTTSQTYATDGSDVATPTGTQKRRLTGFADGITDESISIDIYDNQNRSYTQLVTLSDNSSAGVSSSAGVRAHPDASEPVDPANAQTDERRTTDRTDDTDGGDRHPYL